MVELEYIPRNIPLDVGMELRQPKGLPEVVVVDLWGRPHLSERMVSDLAAYSLGRGARTIVYNFQGYLPSMAAEVAVAVLITTQRYKMNISFVGLPMDQVVQCGPLVESWRMVIKERTADTLDDAVNNSIKATASR